MKNFYLSKDNGFHFYNISEKANLLIKLNEGSKGKNGVFIIDFATINSVENLFVQFADNLKFPNYFGKNWNAFDECLGEISNLNYNSYFIVLENTYDFAINFIDDFKTLVMLLKEKMRWYSEDNIIFHLFIVDKEDNIEKLKKIII